MPAYDYDRQQWETDPAAAAALRRRQLQDELDLVTGPRGADYLRFTGRTETPEQAAAVIRAQLAQVQP